MKGTERAANIGPRQRRIRRWGGLFFLAAGVILAFLLTAAGEPRLLRLALFGLFAPGVLGLLQAREATWIFLATRGQCDLDDGPRPIDDLVLFTRLLRQARSLFVRSLGWGLLLTLASLLFPVGLTWSPNVEPARR